MRGIEALLTIFLLSFITEGLCACSLEKFTVGNVRTGRIRQGKLELRVTVINNCACAQSSIKLKCAGFQSTEVVDRSMFAEQGDRCLLKSGKALAPKGSLGQLLLCLGSSVPFVASRVGLDWLLKTVDTGKTEKKVSMFPLFISKCHRYP